MYKKIFIAIDNSIYSNYCIDLGIEISKKFDSHLVGCHVYDATLHQRRFRDMENGLPPQYQDEKTLQHQRELHTSLINLGLKLISESYLGVFKNKCKDAGVSHEELLLEGKNYHEIIQEVQRNSYDLVILGALGLAAVNENLIGSVCERVVRRINTDVLIVKNNNFQGKVLVAVDGSKQSTAGVASALVFARSFGMKPDAISVFDPHYHRVAFGSIAKVLSQEAGQIFRFKEQETLHEEIIDKGLAKIYQGHLDKAQSVAAQADIRMETILRDGKPYDQILKYISHENPSLLVVGRTGIHNTHGLDLGSTTENLLRLAPCNILLAGGSVPLKKETLLEGKEFHDLNKDKNYLTASYDKAFHEDGLFRKEVFTSAVAKKPIENSCHSVTWTQEATVQTERIPSFIREVVRKKIEEYAKREGFKEITPQIVHDARAGIMADSTFHKS